MHSVRLWLLREVLGEEENVPTHALLALAEAALLYEQATLALPLAHTTLTAFGYQRDNGFLRYPASGPASGVGWEAFAQRVQHAHACMLEAAELARRGSVTWLEHRIWETFVRLKTRACFSLFETVASRLSRGGQAWRYYHRKMVEVPEYVHQPLVPLHTLKQIHTGAILLQGPPEDSPEVGEYIEARARVAMEAAENYTSEARTADSFEAFMSLARSSLFPAHVAEDLFNWAAERIPARRQELILRANVASELAVSAAETIKWCGFKAALWPFGLPSRPSAAEVLAAVEDKSATYPHFPDFFLDAWEGTVPFTRIAAPEGYTPVEEVLAAVSDSVRAEPCFVAARQLLAAFLEPAAPVAIDEVAFEAPLMATEYKNAGHGSPVIKAWVEYPEGWGEGRD